MKKVTTVKINLVEKNAPSEQGIKGFSEQVIRLVKVGEPDAA